MSELRNAISPYLRQYTAAPAVLLQEQGSTAAARRLQGLFDTTHGGFGRGHKFPNTMALEWLLHYAWYTSGLNSFSHLHKTTNRMLQGGYTMPLVAAFSGTLLTRSGRLPISKNAI